MINCPDCKSNELYVINSRLTLSGGYIKRRLKCGCCDARFTSHEIREADLTDTNAEHFSTVLDKIRSQARVPKPFRGMVKPKPEKVFVSRSWLQRLSPCCFGSGKDTVNY